MKTPRALLMAVLALTGLYAFGWAILDGFVLDLGSIHLPRPGAMSFMAFYTVLGTVFAASLALALAGTRTGKELWERVRTGAASIPDGQWIIAASLLAFLGAAVVRVLLLDGADLTDDESAYRFMSQVLAGGRVTADSPPGKLFFDRIFMVNDGEYFAQYFLGWPALMLPGTLIGAAGWMNALYSALTVPALFLVLRRVAGRGGAQLGTALFLTSPLLTTGAATGLSHTSCLMLLTWLTWATLRASDEEAPAWIHATVGGLFAAAFFVRPATAVGLGTPLLILWLLRLRRGKRLLPLASCAAPALILAGLFLAVNQAQTGSWLGTAYERYRGYAVENGMRFYFPGGFTEPASQWQMSDPVLSMAYSTNALLRLNLSLFGWPLSLLFIPFAARGEGRVFGWMLALFFGIHFFTWDAGVDAFGPVHYFETALPLIVLSVLGIQAAHRWFAALPIADAGPWKALVPAMVLSMVVASVVVYGPARGGALHRMAEAIELPQDAVTEAGLEQAVIFTPFPFVPDCARRPTWNWRFYWPMNSPDLDDDVLWVNHLEHGLDLALLRDHFPDRKGFYLGWTRECRPVLVPLDAPGLEIPRGSMLGVDRILPTDDLPGGP